MPQASTILPADSVSAPPGTISAANPADTASWLAAVTHATRCFESDAPTALREKSITVTGRIPYTEGLRPEPRSLLPGYDTGVMSLLIALFLLIAINSRHYSTFIKTLARNLFSVRGRANAFDEHNTTSEVRVLASLVTLVCVCEGIIMFSAVNILHPGIHVAPAILAATGIALAYYLWQLIAYRAVGYVFGQDNQSPLWLKGFNASQSLLGIALVVPALTVLFRPDLSELLISISAVLYLIARIIFISKGFRIFYHHSFSLLYFILYLCTLEIIPPLLVIKAAFFIVTII